MRAVIYARYSTSKQSAASIEDQTRVCEALAARSGWDVVRVYSDPEMSGTLRNRPGLLSMIDDARHGRFDVVVAESLDRLARDLEDASWIGKRLSYNHVRIFTHAEGEIDELKIAVAGLLGSMYVKNLAQKTWRGLEGAVLAGRLGGGRAYGYEVYSEIGTNGKPVNGLLRIDESEADVVRQIFHDFAIGKSAIQIVKGLNVAKVPGPRGGQWNASTVRGDPKKLVGILHNPLYRGELVWNRRQWRKNPETEERRRTYRLREQSEWITVSLPDLRIVDDELWQAVQQRVAELSRPQKTGSLVDRRRPKHLLSGRIKCGTCGARYVISGKDYYRCAGQKERGTCGNSMSVRQAPLEEAVLSQLQTQLLTPELAQVFIEEFKRETERLRKKASITVDGSVAELKDLTQQIDNIVDAIASGIASPTLMARLSSLEERRNQLLAQSAATSATPSADILPHPVLIRLFQEKVANLRAILNEESARTEAAMILRDLIEEVIIHPSADGAEIELVGELARLIGFAQNDNSRPSEGLNGCSVSVVAGTGFEPVTFRL